MRLLRAAVLLSLLLSRVAAGFEPFVVGDIKVEGLQRISAGTVFNYLPLSVGERADGERVSRAIEELYGTGFFKDVEILREGDVLVVSVTERPSIADVSFTGNEAIGTEQLTDSLRQIGLAQGRVFNRSLLEKIEQELRRQYFARGKYGVQIETTVTPLERNRVGINIDIVEGEVARIKQINLVGNKSYDAETLKDEFTLSPPTLFSFYTKNDQYSKDKLSGDLEALRSFYLNRGFVNYRIQSTQVSLTPDKRHIYITVNMTEGKQYDVSDVAVSGDLILAEDEIRELIKVEPGQRFSREDVSESSNAITEALGNKGYAFANVNAIPRPDEEAGTVKVTFFVDPGKRVYVRRVNFAGNYRTEDQVLRRELRQMEGGWFSTEKVRLTRQRLERLGYFESVNVETPSVPGESDQVDVNYSVKERLSGNLTFGVGYGQTQGVLLNASVRQNNFLGTGNSVSFNVNNSDVIEEYAFSYTNPYYTLNGVSRTFGASYRKVNAEEANIASYSTDVANGRVNYGIPLAEFDTFDIGGEVEQTSINTTGNTPQIVTDFIGQHGDTYATGKLNASWTRDTRNRAVLATQGRYHRLSAVVAGGDVAYYKSSYRYQRYFGLTDELTLSLEGDVAYGDGLGNTDKLPFFENYFGGGPKSVRGYEQNTLGPVDPVTDDPVGGNLRVVGTAELLFPPPFDVDESVRLSAFVDGGNVFDTTSDTFDFAAGELRYSAGVSLLWISPFGALRFSLAEPLNAKSGDETQMFQFSLGSPF